MRRADYIAEPSIVTAVHLARAMQKPLLVEGDAGVGKTEIAKVMAILMQTELIRLQCYEGLDVNTALYEWNYQKQLLRLRLGTDEAGSDHDDSGTSRGEAAATPDEAGNPSAPNPDARADHLEGVIFGRRYLLERPLLRAITREEPPVLLIDEIDRADEGFEAFLLEVLSDFQVTIPELGTIRATHRPLVVLTSNRTREIATPSGGAASTSTSSTRPSPRRSKSSTPKCRGYRTPSPHRSRTSCKACARGAS